MRRVTKDLLERKLQTCCDLARSSNLDISSSENDPLKIFYNDKQYGTLHGEHCLKRWDFLRDEYAYLQIGSMFMLYMYLCGYERGFTDKSGRIG